MCYRQSDHWGTHRLLMHHIKRWAAKPPVGLNVKAQLGIQSGDRDVLGMHGLDLGIVIKMGIVVRFQPEHMSGLLTKAGPNHSTHNKEGPTDRWNFGVTKMRCSAA